jgi:FkbM family methyltransferase
MFKVENVCQHSFIGNWLNSNSTVIDLGMNKGEFTQYIAEHFGCHILGAEANPHVFQKLPKYERLIAKNVAIAAKDGTSTLNIPKEGDASLYFNENCNSEQIEVEAETFQSFVKTFSLERIDLVKVDIEGAEIDMFDLTENDILQNVVQFTVEFHDFVDLKMKPKVEKVFRQLNTLGFQRINFSLNNGDVLFVNKKFCRFSFLEYINIVVFYKYLPGIKRRLSRIFHH